MYIKSMIFIFKLFVIGVSIRFGAILLISIFGIFVEGEGIASFKEFWEAYFSPPYFDGFSTRNFLYYIIIGPIVETLVLYPFLRIASKRLVIRIISLAFVVVAAYLLHGGGISGLISAWAFLWFLLIGWKFSRAKWKSLAIVAFVHASANFSVLIFSA